MVELIQGERNILPLATEGTSHSQGFPVQCFPQKLRLIPGTTVLQRNAPDRHDEPNYISQRDLRLSIICIRFLFWVVWDRKKNKDSESVKKERERGKIKRQKKKERWKSVGGTE
jgi:hypothetical protein